MIATCEADNCHIGLIVTPLKIWNNTVLCYMFGTLKREIFWNICHAFMYKISLKSQNLKCLRNISVNNNDNLLLFKSQQIYAKIKIDCFLQIHSKYKIFNIFDYTVVMNKKDVRLSYVKSCHGLFLGTVGWRSSLNSLSVI